MKNIWAWIVIIVLVGFGYAYRSQIMAMFGGAYSSPSSTSYLPATSSPSVAATGQTLSWMGTSPGQYGVGANGMTLYTFDKDTKGVSNCNGNCAGIWPPYTTATTPSTLPANVTVIKRADGSMQFAYTGMPLYYYASDQKAGDMTGDGVGGTWHVAKP
jgi:predicted lipoprotein with Yx(FWY)xxD motif